MKTSPLASTPHREGPVAVPVEGDPAAGKRHITDAHTAAIVVGRAETATVRRYLESLDLNRPRPGRPRTGNLSTRIAELNERAAATAPGIEKLKLVQERLDVEAELATVGNTSDPAQHDELEAQFVAVAASYSTRQNISWTAWRTLSVPATVLRQAGIRP